MSAYGFANFHNCLFHEEIESLLKDVIIHQIENEDRKSKKHLTECKILTGMLQLNSFVD